MKTDLALRGVDVRPGLASLFCIDREKTLLSVAILGVLSLQVFLVFTKSINWDEFFHFSQIYELRRGALTRDLQVLHTRVFSWAPLVANDIFGQLLAARLAMLGFELVALLSIIGLARRFTDERSALLAGLAWISGGFVFLHGFSFRGDPMATAALMAALYLWSCRHLNWATVVLASALIGFAFMATMKSVFYIPCFAGMAWLRYSQSDDRSALLFRLCAICILTPIFFALIYSFHRSGLPIGEAAIGKTSIQSSGTRYFAEGLFPRWQYALEQIAIAPALTISVLVSAVLSWRTSRPREERFALISLLFPLAMIAIYRNSFPYYFVFALAPCAVAIGAGLAWLRQRYNLTLVILAFVASPLMLVAREPRDVLDRQRAVMTEVNRLFAKDAVHLSYSGMAADYPRIVNVLVSGVGIENYNRRQRPVIAEHVAQGRLAFVIADHPNLDAAMRGTPNPNTLLLEDAAALQRNFVRYWGPLWLPGKSVDDTGSVTIDIAGQYVVDRGGVRIAGEPVMEGEAVLLEAGVHNIAPIDGRSAVLWRGNSVPIPPDEPIGGPLYTSF